MEQEERTVIDLLGEMLVLTEEEIKAEADIERLETLHSRLQEYIKLSLESSRVF